MEKFKHNNLEKELDELQMLKYMQEDTITKLEVLCDESLSKIKQFNNKIKTTNIAKKVCLSLTGINFLLPIIQFSLIPYFIATFAFTSAGFLFSAQEHKNAIKEYENEKEKYKSLNTDLENENIALKETNQNISNIEKQIENAKNNSKKMNQKQINGSVAKNVINNKQQNKEDNNSSLTLTK